MILVVVIGIWLGVVVIAVAIDAGTSYLAERSVEPKQRKTTKTITERVSGVKKEIEAYRNRKKLVTGLTMISEREESVVRPRGTHRRLQVS